MDVIKLLPLAFVMIAGPQIILAFLFATSESWRGISVAYVAGAAASIPLVVLAGYLLAKGAGEGGEDSGLSATDYVVLGLLVFVAVRTFLKRGASDPPRWMSKLQSATPKTGFVYGFLLLGFFPSDLVTSLSVGGFLASRGDPYWHALSFVLLTLAILFLPALFVFTMGRRARTLMPRIRAWMDHNSWIVSEVVLVFFIAIVLTG